MVAIQLAVASSTQSKEDIRGGISLREVQPPEAIGCLPYELSKSKV